MFLQEKAIKASIFLLWIGAVLDPVGWFYVRYLALGFSGLVIIYLLVAGDTYYIKNLLHMVMILLVGFVMPVYGLLIYSVHAGDAEFIDTSYIAAGVLIITSLLYKNKDACKFGIRSLIFSTRLLSLLIISVFVSQFLNFTDWYWIFVEGQVALISQREYAGISIPYIYFVASPLLILLLAHEWNTVILGCGRFRYLNFFVATFALFLSGTRYNMLISVFYVPIYLLLNGNIKIKIGTIILVFLAIISAVFALDGYLFLVSVFSAVDDSNSVKLAYLDAYSVIFGKPFYLIFGQGFNAHEWSSEFREMLPTDYAASRTELTYIELIRVYGIFMGMFFLFMILIAVIKLKSLVHDYKWIYTGFVVLLASSALNPYLFSSNGMLPLGLFLSCIYFENLRSSKPIIKSERF